MLFKIKHFFSQLFEKIKESAFWQKLSYITPKQWIIGGVVTLLAIVLIVLAIIFIPMFSALSGPTVSNTNTNNNNHQVNLNATPSEIYIATAPSKTKYMVGDSPDYSGLVIGVMQDNNNRFELSYDVYYKEMEITGFDSSIAVDEQEITVKYKDFTATFNIQIVRPDGKYLTGIRIDPLPNKTQYKLGEALSYTGGRVVPIYSDGTEGEPMRFKEQGITVSGFSAISTLGTHEIKVEYYDENGQYAYTTYEIEIVE